MKTNDFRSLAAAALSVQHRKNPEYVQKLNESFNLSGKKAQSSTVPQPILEAISQTIHLTEQKLGIQFTPEEISYSTGYILQGIKSRYIVETVEKAVGFQLNENEIKYVLSTLNEG